MSTITDRTGARSAPVLSLLPDPAPRLMTTVRAMASASQAAADGAYMAMAAARERVVAAEIALGNYTDGSGRNEGKRLDPAEVARLERDVAEAKEAERIVQAMGIGGAGHVAAEVDRRVSVWVRGLGGTKPRMVSAKSTDADIGSLRDRRGDIQVQQQELIEDCVVPLEEAWARIELEHDKSAARGAPKARITKVGAHPNHPRGRTTTTVVIEWPTATDWTVETRGDDPLTTPDVVAMFTWAHSDAIKASLRASLEESYRRHTGPVLSHAEQAKRRRALQGELLTIERQIAAKAWEMIDAGDASAVRFLDGLDPQAILGVGV